MNDLFRIRNYNYDYIFPCSTTFTTFSTFTHFIFVSSFCKNQLCYFNPKFDNLSSKKNKFSLVWNTWVYKTNSDSIDQFANLEIYNAMRYLQLC